MKVTEAIRRGVAKVQDAYNHQVKIAEARATAKMARAKSKLEKERIKAELALEKAKLETRMYKAKAAVRREKELAAKARIEAGELTFWERTRLTYRSLASPKKRTVRRKRKPIRKARSSKR